MIEDKFVDLYARNSGLRDKLVAERDVVLTYALRVLLDTGVMDHLAFKGGTCLRKLIFGSAGRFSEDLDFTLDTDRPDDDVLTELVEVFNAEHHGIAFTFDEYYKTDDDTSFGGDVYYKHAWNEAGHFRLQVSLRERPTLPVVAGAMKAQAYFSHLEFELFDVRALDAVEMIAEKVRAAYQRVKVRDLYDLHRFATTPFNGELLRRLAVLKLWLFHPSRCSSRRGSAVAGCSVSEVIMCFLWRNFSATPRIARLLASVPPEVNTISSGAAPNRAATCARAPSTAA